MNLQATVAYKMISIFYSYSMLYTDVHVTKMVDRNLSFFCAEIFL